MACRLEWTELHHLFGAASVPAEAQLEIEKEIAKNHTGRTIEETVNQLPAGAALKR